jgi:hypothetical protein
MARDAPAASKSSALRRVGRCGGHHRPDEADGCQKDQRFAHHGNYSFRANVTALLWVVHRISHWQKESSELSKSSGRLCRLTNAFDEDATKVFLVIGSIIAEFCGRRMYEPMNALDRTVQADGMALSGGSRSWVPQNGFIGTP